MHGMCLSGKVDLFGTRASKLGATKKLACILALIIVVEVAKTNASFLSVY